METRIQLKEYDIHICKAHIESKPKPALRIHGTQSASLISWKIVVFLTSINLELKKNYEDDTRTTGKSSFLQAVFISL